MWEKGEESKRLRKSLSQRRILRALVDCNKLVTTKTPLRAIGPTSALAGSLGARGLVRPLSETSERPGMGGERGGGWASLLICVCVRALACDILSALSL